jgi:hypothetical protein
VQKYMEHINTLCGQNGVFLGAFPKLRKATINFVTCLSVRIVKLGSHWKDFREMLTSGHFFETLSIKFKFY